MDQKFTNKMIEFINGNYSCDIHTILVLSSSKELKFVKNPEKCSNIIVVHKTIAGLLTIINKMKKADKIILHGMFIERIVRLIKLFDFSHKVYWNIWGGDVYDYYKDSPKKRKMRTKVVSKMRGIITTFEQDYELAKTAYGATGKMFYALLPTSTIDDIDIVNSEKSLKYFDRNEVGTINILVGNSADCENNHSYIFELLERFSDKDIRIYIPLSYGDKVYAEKVAEQAKAIFGDKAVPLMDYMNIDEYYAFLTKIDVVVYAHNRQQAFTNSVRLVLNGAKIYMRRTAVWNWLQQKGCKIYDVDEDIDTLLQPMTKQQRNENHMCIMKATDPAYLVEQWSAVFND